MKKWIVIVVVLAACGYWGFLKLRQWKQSSQQPDEGSRPTMAVASLTNVNLAITAAGDIGPADQVSVRPEINGLIDTLPVDIGDVVKKDSVLFTLDDRPLQTDRAARLTDIEGAQLTVAKTKRNYERAKQLFEDKLISQEVYEDSKTDYDLAQNALDRAQKALSQVQEQLTKTKILAPFDCTILTRPVSIGQAVSGSGGFNSGTEVLTIANLNDMIITAHFNQADVARLKANMPVDVEVEAVPGLKLTGTIDRLAPQATVKNGIKGFDARILLTNIDPRVRPGMTANLSIPVASASNVLTVPLAAVFSEMGDHYVLVKKDDKFERRPVQIGVADYFFVEIQKGLSNGEIVSLEQPAGAAALFQNEIASQMQNKRAAGVVPASLTTTNRLLTSTNRPNAVPPQPAGPSRRTNSGPARLTGVPNRLAAGFFAP